MERMGANQIYVQFLLDFNSVYFPGRQRRETSTVKSVYVAPYQIWISSPRARQTDRPTDWLIDNSKDSCKQFVGPGKVMLGELNCRWHVDLWRPIKDGARRNLSSRSAECETDRKENNQLLQQRWQTRLQPQIMSPPNLLLTLPLPWKTKHSLGSQLKINCHV